MKLLKGKAIATKILIDIKGKIKRQRVKPALAVFYVGSDKASRLYINLKKKAAKNTGLGFKLFRFPASAKETAIVHTLKKAGVDEAIHGIIVQLPLPKKFDTQRVINAINPEKDVDGFNPKNTALFLKNKENFWPVFPSAIVNLLESASIPLKNKRAIVIANSKIFGQLMTAALVKKKISARYILSNTLAKNKRAVKSADIIISAVGKPGVIIGEMIKKGAIIIDGGISKKGKKVLGDVDARSVGKIAGFLSPVPGGVGPVTIACLLKNVYLAAIKK